MCGSLMNMGNSSFLKLQFIKPSETLIQEHRGEALCKWSAEEMVIPGMEVQSVEYWEMSHLHNKKLQHHTPPEVPR